MKFGWKTLKCSVHFKDEIDNNAVFSTIDFLKAKNSQTRSNKEVQDISLDCENYYIKYKHIFNIFLIIFIC